MAVHNLRRQQFLERLRRMQHQQEVWAKSKGRCWYCGVQTHMCVARIPEQFCIDHVVPSSAGGTDDLTNLVPACCTCNGRKGVLSVEEFRAKEARRGLPLFTTEHIAYLRHLKIPLPEDFPCYPTITFWFEAPDNPAAQRRFVASRTDLESQRQAAADAAAWQAELAERVEQARLDALRKHYEESEHHRKN